jgi:2,4-dienoyl-CoA reductase-like NADH-dependent reductase (Old Yellow Enzyme family)
MSGLFDPMQIKGLQLKNRVMMSSMCQYQAEKKEAAKQLGVDVGLPGVYNMGF